MAVTKYKASPTVSLFHADDTFIRGIMGPYGSGKSVGMCFEIMLRAQQMPKSKNGKRRSRWAIIRNTYRELLDTTIRTWFEWFPEEQFGQFHKNDLIHYIRFGDVELDVMFRALDKPEDAKKLLSMELTGAWINEAREVPKPILDALSGRVGRFPRPGELNYWSGIIMDTNPPDTDHWWYMLAEEPERFIRVGNPNINDKDLAVEISNIQKMYKFYRQPGGLSEDAENLQNQIKNKKGESIYYQRMMVGKNPEWVKVYVKGEYGFIVDGKMVYPEYIDQVHCPEDKNFVPIPNVEIFRGWDFGLTPACVFMQLTSRGQVVILDELISESMAVDRFSDHVISYCAKRYPQAKFIDYGDPAGMARSQTDEKSCFNILHAKNIEILPAKQDYTLRLGSVKKALLSMVDGLPGFQMDRRCRMLRKGFMGGYQYKRLNLSGFEKYQDKPDKNMYSHVHDALQYVLSMVIGQGLIDKTFNYFENENGEDYYHEDRTKGRSPVCGY